MSKQIIDQKMVKRIAGIEMNSLLYAKMIPIEVYKGARIAATSTPIHDINGSILFYRTPITIGKLNLGYCDIAATTAFQHPLLGISHGCPWEERNIISQATENLEKRKRKIKFDKARFVAYSYPKIAVQFLLDNKEVGMLELFSWKPVPPKQPPDEKRSWANFERWSLLDEVPKRKHLTNEKKMQTYLQEWNKIFPASLEDKIKVHILSPDALKDVLLIPVISIKKREIHYSNNNSDHMPCYELRGQLTSVWCVAASVQMILDFYRYNYQQTRIAADLGLGTLTSPNGLPYSRDADVVTVLENLSNNALDATMDTSPGWNQFVNEINANRPLISFVPGHSRTVAGYIKAKISSWFQYRGLLVYDPWPPTTGVITRWENFDNHTYRVTYTAKVTMV